MIVKSVELIPDILEQNVLYVSFDYSTAIHLCMCGCNNQVVTPLNPEGWQLKYDGAVTLYPSIGNWSFKCRSHYWIRNGQAIDCDTDEVFPKTLTQTKKVKVKEESSLKKLLMFFKGLFSRSKSS